MTPRVPNNKSDPSEIRTDRLILPPDPAEALGGERAEGTFFRGGSGPARPLLGEESRALAPGRDVARLFFFLSGNRRLRILGSPFSTLTSKMPFQSLRSRADILSHAWTEPADMVNAWPVTPRASSLAR